MKKYSKLLMVGLIAFFISAIPVFARNVTLTELEEKVNEMYPEEEHDIQDIYIIGEYAFTSEYILDTQDVMLAARSIKVSDETGETNKDKIFNEMTISHLQRSYSNGKYTAWGNDNPIVGTSKIDKDDTINIRYIDYEFYAEDTKINLTTDLSDKEDYTSVLQKALSFKADEAYENGKIENDNGKLKGLLLKNEKITLNADDKAKYNNPVYFFAYVLEIEGANENTTIKVDGINGPGEILWKDFDVTPDKEGCEDKTPGIVVLVPVNPDKLKEKSTIEITVDLDGNLKEYGSSKYTFDLSELKFQQASNATVDLNKATDADKETMKGWKYRSELNQDLELDKDGNLKGTLVKQSLKNNVFKENEGYYFDFTFVTPDGISKDNVKIKHVNKDGTLIKEFKPGEFDDQNNLTILYQFPSTQTNCTGDECKLYYTVDFDGDGTEYFPTTYVIDYSKVKFEKLSEFTVSDVDEIDYEDESWKGWDKPENYETKFTSNEENPFVVKVTGLIPIDKDAFEDDNDPFTGDEYGYYLAFKLTKKEGSSSDEINVKFLHGVGYDDDDNDPNDVITDKDFGSGKELYVLKYINPLKKSNFPQLKTQFDVVVDFDGDAEVYAPYTITIDWSELDFQSESLFTDVKIANKDATKGEDGYISETDKSQIAGWGYDFDKAGENLALNGHYELTGKVKEQSVDAGFKSKDGYYVPIKIYGPTNEDVSGSHYLTTQGNKKWTVELNTEDNKTKIVTPTDEDYENGFITVLFKLKNDSSDKKITYKIDWDGEENYFLPYEETISYNSLDFISKNTITYKYTGKDGKEKTETETVYEGEQIPNKELTEEQNDYRKLDGWYKGNEKIDSETISKEDEDLELQAHWNLNVEKFMEDVVEDLNNPDSTYSDDFSNKFELVQGTENNNEITIKVKSPNVNLSTLSETSIPGTIAYILQKGEIKDVTLTVNDDTEKVFDKNIVRTVISPKTKSNSALDETGQAIKTKIIEDAKEAFNTELQKSSGTEKDATMDQVEFEGITFKLKVGEAANDTVKLVNNSGETIDGKDTYTFKFDSDFAVIDQNDTLGPDSIKEAIDKNSYDTIYIDGDYTEAKMVEITTTKDVSIEPIENFAKTSGLMTAAEAPEHSITVSNDPDFAMDIESTNGKTVTISDLKITGGKKGEIKVGTNAIVNVNNIDVSGTIEASQKTEETDDMHAYILVEGILNATNVKNSNEKYETPTIALVTDFGYPSSSVTGEDNDNSSKNKNLHANAKVTENSGMAKNGKYYIVKQNDATNSDKIEESYYGSFYYVKNENSQIYFVTMIDRFKNPDGGGIDLFKIYKYGDTIDIASLGYESDKSLSKDETKVFDKFEVSQVGSSTQVSKEFRENVNAENVLQPHVTNQIVAKYKTKPVTALTVASIDGISNKNNSLSGTLKVQDKSGKYNIPVTIASDKFEEGVSTVDVVDPNGKVENYTYSSSKTKEASQKTMTIDLEALKESRITGENGKVYTIKVDVDGAKNNYEEEIYTVDYSDVNTLEEIINKAAENTHNANSFTVKKDNKINGYSEKFTYEFNKETGLTHLKSENGDDVEEYSFSLKYVGKNDSKVSVVVRKQTKHEEGKVYLNDWEYLHPQQVGTAIHEVTMLTDVMGETYINAIDKVTKDTDKDHTYIVTLNKDRYNNWIKKNYLSNPKYSFAEWSLSDTVVVKVELDDNDKYIKSIITSEGDSINTFNVSFSKINETDIKQPKEFLANGTTLTDDDIVEFYKKGVEWWEEHTGGTVVSE